MPNETRLDLEQTFDAQKNIVNNNIVPTVMETLDLETFPVSEGIVYEIIHNCHKHQREEHLLKQKSEESQDEYFRRRHLNSRRNDVSDESFTIY
jgi:hypothetical protein